MRKRLAALVLALLTATSTAVVASGEAEARPCWRYRQIALNQGFTRAQWRWPMRHIMWRESRCLPWAYNSSSGATGLMQIMPFWADDCGGWPARLFRPRFNIHCARHVYRVQGWDAWSTFDG